METHLLDLLNERSEVRVALRLEAFLKRVEMQDQRATLLIPELAMLAKLRLQTPVALDTELRLGLRGVDIPDQIARFRVLDKV